MLPPEELPDTLAPEFPDESGQPRAPDTDLPYAPGPYGLIEGSTLPNLAFYGWVDPLAAGTDTALIVRIELAHFYNPTGDGTYPEGTPFPAGSPKPKALLINMSGYWCPVCRDEAEIVLPGRYETYKPQGGEFLMVLADSNTPGIPATYSNLKNWANQNDIVYPLVIDPRYQLGWTMPEPAWPANFVVDPRNMKIIRTDVGAPSFGFWNAFLDVLEGTGEP
jgi:hypothetical protein